MSKLIQNTLLFGDMALRFPAFMHRVYDSDQTIRQLIKWSFDFVSNTKITEGTNAEQTIPMVSWSMPQFFIIITTGMALGKTSLPLL